MNIVNVIRRWLEYSSIDFRLERYLASSSDLVDLEHKQRNWAYMSDAEKNRW